MNRLRINLLGGAQAHWENGGRIAFPTRKAAGLLAYIAMNAPNGASRVALAGLYWAELPDESARASLRRTLHEVSTALGPEAEQVLAVDRERASLIDTAVSVDVLDFEAACHTESLASLRAARALYAGRFLAGFESESEVFERWHATEAMRLEDLASQAFAKLAERALHSGEIAEALGVSSQLLEIDPLHEVACRLHMRALAASGRRAEALRRYDAFADRLDAELSSIPEERTAELCEHIRRGEAILPKTPFKQPDAPSIVVLPMENVSGERAHDFVAEGLTETLTAELSRDRSLFVIARNSAAVYHKRLLSAPEIAADLGVRYLLIGGMQIVQDRLRVNVQLVDGADGGHVWAEKYDRPFAEFLTVQDEMVAQIVATLRGYKGAVQRAELKRSLSKPDIELTAYENLMRGMAHKEKFLREDMLIARNYFDQAIAQCPAFAMAHGWLAWTWFFDVYMGWVDDPQPSLDRTFEAAREAVRLDPSLDFAHWALGAAHLAAGDHGNSLRCFDKALELNPSNSDALANSAWPLSFSGRPDDAIDNLSRAMRLNPYYPDWYLWGAGIAEYSRGNDRRAADALGKIAQPNSQSHAYLAASLQRLGEAKAAQSVMAELLALEPGFTVDQLMRSLTYTDPRVPERLAEDLTRLGLPAGP